MKEPRTNPDKSGQEPRTLIVICGPTAAGKTSLAIDVAKRFSAHIISADSRQFYREMNIGTAKPTDAELAEVPHHFVNNVSIHMRHYSAGSFEEEVLEFLEQYFKQHDVCVMVGGSGLFIDAVCSGFDKMRNEEQRNRDDHKETRDEYTRRKFLNAQTLEWLQTEVQRLDEEYFAVVDKKNPVRLKRALEVIYSTGKKYSEQRIGRKAERPFRSIKVGLMWEREALYERINLRVDEMMQQGLLEEVKALYLHRKQNALNTVGYVELFDFIEDKISLPEAVELIKRNTRNYAKRQMTWFKRDHNIRWFTLEEHVALMDYLVSELQAA